MAGTRDLTDKQKSLLDYIVSVQRVSGYPPSIKEIASHFGYKSLTSVVDHLNALERKGLINRQGGARTISITVKGADVSQLTDESTVTLVPLIGKVAAGEPICAVENIEEYFAIDKRLVRYGNAFILRVSGDSMINAHIEHGDMVLVKPQATAENNDIIVAIIGNEATVKRFIVRKNYIELKPENEAMSPIKVSLEDQSFRIAGKVIGIFRKYN